MKETYLLGKKNFLLTPLANFSKGVFQRQAGIIFFIARFKKKGRTQSNFLFLIAVTFI